MTHEGSAGWIRIGAIEASRSIPRSSQIGTGFFGQAMAMPFELAGNEFYG
jgi:hypothetical protein